MKIRKIIYIIIFALSIIIFLSGCSHLFLSREYRDDIRVQLDGYDGDLVIKEWSFLLGNGAEIYYDSGYGMLELGQVHGINNYPSYPFENGLYSLEVNGEQITLTWCSSYKNAEIYENWKRDTFTLTVDDINRAKTEKLLLHVGIALAACVAIGGVVIFFVCKKKNKA